MGYNSQSLIKDLETAPADGLDEPRKKQELIVKYQLAVKVAIKAIDKEMHQYALDTNLFRRGLVSIAGERANKEYTKLENARERLKQGVLFQ